MLKYFDRKGMKRSARLMDADGKVVGAGKVCPPTMPVGAG
jgi:hypothetical protein